MIDIPDELLVIDYDDSPGTHLAGSRQGVIIHLCSASRSTEMELQPPRRVDQPDDRTLAEIDCASCLALLEEIRSRLPGMLS